LTVFARIIGAVLLSLALSAAAQAKSLKFSASLTGGEEVPANTLMGTGKVTAKLDVEKKTFSYKATYSKLTGPATAAHFHGPAGYGFNAPPTLPITNLASPIEGVATLTDPQIAELTKGRWYFNVHTAAHPGGEIRGQLKSER
jgi:hypothetical protein